MKKGNIMRDVISSSQFTANVIKEYKKGLGDVVLVAITPRTTIEITESIVVPPGIEPGTQGFSVLCSTN